MYFVRGRMATITHRREHSMKPQLSLAKSALNIDAWLYTHAYVLQLQSGSAHAVSTHGLIVR